MTYLFVVWFMIVVGCASFGTLKPETAAKASNAVTVAQGLLYALDGFYNDLVLLKAVPDKTQQATRALAIADVSAAALRQVIAGASITDEQLNVLAGQVAGSQAILNQAK